MLSLAANTTLREQDEFCFYFIEFDLFIPNSRGPRGAKAEDAGKDEGFGNGETLKILKVRQKIAY